MIVCISQEVESWKAHIRKKSGDNILDDEVLAARPPSPIKSVSVRCQLSVGTNYRTSIIALSLICSERRNAEKYGVVVHV